MEEKFILVEERIWLVNRLIEASAHFSGMEHLIDLEGGWDHPYKHYSALRNYLILTCFDILGQPAEWVDFNTWLVSSSKSVEREQCFLKLTTKDSLQIVKFVYNCYSEIYGVKNSFFRFINEILSEKNRKKLFDSIKGYKITKDPVIHPDGSHTSGLSEEVEIDESKKSKLLFLIRNSFTHKGISMSSGAAGIFPGFDLLGPPAPGMKPGYNSHLIYRDTVKGEKFEYNSFGWPFILSEIIEDTILEMKKGI